MNIRRPKNWHRAAVVGLVLAGATSLAHAQTAPQTPPPGEAQTRLRPPSPPRFHEIIGRMSPEGREIMGEAVRKGASEKKRWHALKETREDILRLIAAPSLDAEALERAFMRERKLSAKLQTSRHEALLNASRRLSAEDRKIFAEALRSTRLHIPGETIKQMTKSKERCTDEKDGDRKAR